MQRTFVALIFLLSLAGCDSEPQTAPTDFLVRAPDRVTQAVTVDELRVEVTIDGAPFAVQPGPSMTVWRGSSSLPTDRVLPLTVRWLFGDIIVAMFDTEIGPIADGESLAVGPEDYITTGPLFDEDADGVNNLQELVNGTNPVDSLDIDVRIPRVIESDTPGINGDTGVVWNDNRISDWRGAELSVDNLMIDRGATRPDGQTGFRWQAVHNGETLSIIVFAEDAEGGTPVGDSNVAESDDAINIFIDGDNSKLSSFDGVNDFHITIPLLMLTDSTTGEIVANQIDMTDGNLLNDGRIFFGPLSDRLRDNVRFVNGVPDTGQQIYELEIPLDVLDISFNQPFGFDIQIDDDVDGGDIEARYGWRHPSREPDGPDVNNTVNNPSFMGTLILE